MSADVVNLITQEMKHRLDSLQKELSKVRTGKASPTLLDPVHVDYYGSNVPLQQIANVSTPDARLIQVVPWEANLLPAIEKAILAANLGLTPQNDGKVIRVPIPALNEERRKDMVKQVKKVGEDCKIAIRNSRRDGNEKIKKLEKDKVVSQDEAKKLMDRIQKETDSHISNVDKVIETKEREILTV